MHIGNVTKLTQVSGCQDDLMEFDKLGMLVQADLLMVQHLMCMGQSRTGSTWNLQPQSWSASQSYLAQDMLS